MADLIATLRETADTLPAGQGRTEGFAAKVAAAMEVTHGFLKAEELRKGLDTVPCRRCAGKGLVMTQTGWQGCNGHNAMGCVDGRSFTPKAQLEIKLRSARLDVEVHRAAWKALAALTPITKADHRLVARSLDHIKTHGTFARRNLDSLSR